MVHLEPAVKKETAFVALWVGVALVLVQAVCLVPGWWSWPVLWGSLLGSATAIINFLLVGLMVQKAVTQTEKQAKNTVRLSQGGRLLFQGGILVLAGALPGVFNLWTAIIPLLIPRIAISVREILWAKKHPNPDRPTVGWDEDEDED